MTPYIILVAAIIALGTTHAYAEKPIMDKNTELLVAAFLQGGPSSHTLAGPGLSILNAEKQEILASVQPNVFVTVINLGKGPIRLVGIDESEVLGTIGPFQTKAVFVGFNPERTSMGLIGDGQNHGTALWRVDIFNEKIETDTP